MPTPPERSVLVTDGGNGQGRSALAAVRGLARGGWNPVVTVTGRPSLAAWSRHRAEVREMPGVSDGVETYGAALRQEVVEGRYAAVMPASDVALAALGSPVTSLLDKVSLAAAAADVGLSSPQARRFASWDELVDGVHGLVFPVVVKPRRSTAPARSFDGPAALLAAPVSGELLVQRRIDEPMSAVCGVCHEGRLVAVVHQRYLRTWPVPCGTAAAAETVAADTQIEARLERLLDGHEGVFQAQFAGHELLDVNPRVYGSLALAIAAGVNLPSLHCALATGATAPPAAPLRGRTGVRYRWLEGDLRHVARAVARREMAPSEALAAIRPRRHTAHSVTTLTDPLPGLARFAYLLAGRR